LAACAATPPQPGLASRIDALLPASVLLLGEQHDAPQHHALERETVELLAGRGQLAALAMEMAEAGHSTAGLARDASEEQVQAALKWNEAGWPWSDYGPVVMAAMRAGVNVHGANLPLTAMRESMRNSALDGSLRGPALKAQQQAIRMGHCGMLPESQIGPMTRIQIARDQRMAEVVTGLASQAPQGKLVLLVAGGSHVDRFAGIPQHLAPDLNVKVALARAESASSAINSGADPERAPIQADAVWATPALPPKDYCAEFRAPGEKPAPPKAPGSK